MNENIHNQFSPPTKVGTRCSRVSWACNECRGRKIRCTGRQPCLPCKESERYCSFTSTTRQRLDGAPRTKILEDRLARARNLITKLLAENKSSQEWDIELHDIFGTLEGSPPPVADTPSTVDFGSRYSEGISKNDRKGRSASRGNYMQSHSHFSGFKSLLATLEQLEPSSTVQGKISALGRSISVLSNVFDSELPKQRHLASKICFADLLPSRQTAEELLRVVFRPTYSLVQFLDEPTFRKQTSRIYDLDPMDLERSDHEFLPLFCSVTALGHLWHQERLSRYGGAMSFKYAMAYYNTARNTVNLDQCRDISSLQTLLCMSIFLMSTTRLATARTYIALAVAASTKMGLHSTVHCEKLCPLEMNIRRRLYWTIVRLDMYSSIVLGLPPFINLDYAGKLNPDGVTKDYANEDYGESVSPTTRLAFAASEQHIEILMIVCKSVHSQEIQTDTYRRSSNIEESQTSGSDLSVAMKELKAWRDGLSQAISSSSPSKFLISGLFYDLEMTYYLGHILLCLPFLHNLAKPQGEDLQNSHLRHAASCVIISRLTISRCSEMVRQGFFQPAAWSSHYPIFLSLVVLVFFLATQHGNNEYKAIQAETELGIRILASVACQNIGLQNCLDALKALILSISHLVEIDVDQFSQKVDPFLDLQLDRHDERVDVSFSLNEARCPQTD